MANLTATQLLKVVAKAENTIFGEAEKRTFEHALMGNLIAAENTLFLDIKNRKQSDEQPTKVSLFTRNKKASTNVKAANPAMSLGDTFESDIAYIRKVQTFSLSYKILANNTFGYQENFNAEFRRAVISLYEDISAEAIAYMDANRTQLATNSIINFDAVTTDSFLNPAAEKDMFFSNLQAAMRKNKYRPAFTVVGDQRNASEFNRIAAQGSGNATNLQYQIPGVNYISEPQIANTALGLAYSWEQGMFAMTTWNESLNRQGFGDPESNQGFFTTVQDPIFNLMHDLRILRRSIDSSASSGNPQDVEDSFEVATTFAFKTAPLSTATETPIFKFTQQ